MNEAFWDVDVLDKLNFLRRGDRFMLIALDQHGNRVTRFGETTMDGHAVSKTYGWVSGNHYYDDPCETYINVRFDDVEYEWPESNQSLYIMPGLHGIHGDNMSTLGRRAEYILLVSRTTYDRIMADSVKTPEQLHPELAESADQKRREEIECIETEMRALADRLAKIKEPE